MSATGSTPVFFAPREQKAPAPFAIQCAVWGVYGTLHVLAALPVYQEAQWPELMATKLIRATTGLLVGAALLALYSRVARPQLPLARLAIITLVTSIAAGFAWSILDRTALVTAFSVTRHSITWSNFPHGFDLDYPFVMLAWSSAYLALRYWNESRRREQQVLESAVAAREAQLRALAVQINPHFLFNTLNSIRALAAEDAARTREMLTWLAMLLRYALEAPDRGFAPLSLELEAVRTYLSIQQVRFGASLDVAVNASVEALEFSIPAFLLQPIVENAIEHGTEGIDGVLRVRVDAGVDGERLIVVVANTGSLLAGASVLTPGHGLANVRTRLAHAYSGGASVELSSEGSWVLATVRIRSPQND